MHIVQMFTLYWMFILRFKIRIGFRNFKTAQAYETISVNNVILKYVLTISSSL